MFSEIGVQGQKKLASSRILICGCGALGSVLSNILTRSGIGFIRLVDRDFIETDNLQRQALYDEQDVHDNLPKAEAAARKLRRINSSISIEPVIANIDHTNIRKLVDRIDLIVDGTDNFETRFLINDISIEKDIPWIFSGCIGSQGQTMNIIPGRTPCLSCLMETIPPPGIQATCETAGILAAAVQMIASVASAEALKILTGQWNALNPYLTRIDVWKNHLQQIALQELHDEGHCRTCTERVFPWLEGTHGYQMAILCGRNAIQITPKHSVSLSFENLAAVLGNLGKVTYNPFMLRFRIQDYGITLFPDGRAIIQGTDNEELARRLYAQYLGN